MPNWNQILDEIKSSGSTHDLIRRKYLKKLSSYTGRNTIIYYSGWLQKTGIAGMGLNDADKNGFMSVIHKLDKSRGLDLVLHTPGGDLAATESIVDYLRSIFGKDIRALIPQLAMSAGTMIACSTKEIIMGKQSNLGPIDPQINGIPAHGIVEEFRKAKDEIINTPATIPVWQSILAKYGPAFIGECEKAIEWSNKVVKEWLISGMLNRKQNKEDKADRIIEELGDHALTKSHARHITMKKCKEIGLTIKALESDSKLQDALLSVHHSTIHTISSTGAYKIIENQKGTAFIQVIQQYVPKQPRN